MHKLLLSLLILSLLTAFFAAKAHAEYQVPTFMSCTNPQGDVIAQTTNGDHAIAGQDGTVTGADTVYKFNGQVTQCYCPPTELSGIQTNWMEISNLSEEEKQELKNNGWIIIENGSGWGLSNAPYAAQNNTYVCNGQTSQPGSTVTAVVQSADTNNSNSSSSSNNSSSNSSAPAPSSALPNTGGSVELLEAAGLGILFLAISALFKKLSA